MTDTHKSSIISSKARIDQDVSIGPFSIIEDDVEIGSGTKIKSHVVIRKGTRMGRNNVCNHFASIGEDPLDLKYKGEDTYLEIGDENVIREGCVLHRGTVQDGGVTRIGNNNLLMPYAHVAHDCQLANNIILSYCAALAGHAKIADWANMGYGVVISQRCRVGAHAYITPHNLIKNDVPAFVLVDQGAPRAVNRIGLERRSFSKESVNKIEQAYKILYLRHLNMEDALRQIREELGPSPDIDIFIESIEGHNGRGVIRHRNNNKHKTA